MMKRWTIAVCLGLSSVAWMAQASAERVVSLGGSVTEIIYALGQGDSLVADDSSSLYPEAATRLTNVGYYRAVPVEGIVAQAPDLVLASENAGPPKALARLSDLGITIKTVPDKPTLDALYQRIKQVASELNVPEAGVQLTDKVRSDVAAAQNEPSTPRRALVLVNRSGPLMAAGSNTTAAAILALAGLNNAFSEQVGYKPVSAESLAVLAPDMIVITQASLEASGGMDQFQSKAGISSTPAAQHHRIIAMDDLLIQGIGPRVGQAIRQLKQAAR